MKYTSKVEAKAAGITANGRMNVANRREVVRRIGPKRESSAVKAIEKNWHTASIGFLERAVEQIDKIKWTVAGNAPGAHLVSAQEMAEINLMPEEDRMDAIEAYSEVRKSLLKADLFGGQSIERFHETPYIAGNVCVYITRNKITKMPPTAPGINVPRATGPQDSADVWYEDSNDLIDGMLVSGVESYSILKNKWAKFVKEMLPIFRSRTNIIIQCPASIANFMAEECVAIGCQFFVLETDGKIYRPAYAMTDILRTIDEPTSNIKLKLMSMSIGKRIIWPVKNEEMANKISAKLRPLVEMIRKNGYLMEFQYGRFLVDGNLYYLIVKTSDSTPKPSGTITV